MTETLDCRGLKCPLPVVETKKRLGSLEGDSLTVLVDQQVQAQNVSRVVTSAGYIAEIKQCDDHFEVDVTKAIDCALAAAEQEKSGGEGVALLVTSDQIGLDAKLGQLLAKMLLYAAAAADAAPQTVVLMNTGVRLACAGSEALESLQKLVSAGTQILVCGTCLDYFHLTQECVVGTISNIYEIYETLAHSGKVIAP